MKNLEGTYKSVYVSPESDMSDTPSPTSEKRITYKCPACKTWLQPEFGKPSASCKCGTTEWPM